MSSEDNFNYQNIETKQFGGMKVVRKVSVKKGKGYKKIITYKKGKKISTVRKPIHREHVKKIKNGIFVVGLFDDCKNCNKTRKNHR